jgi:hypothetical protein
VAVLDDRGAQDHRVVQAAAVIGVAVVAAVASYEHGYALVRARRDVLDATARTLAFRMGCFNGATDIVLSRSLPDICDFRESSHWHRELLNAG